MPRYVFIVRWASGVTTMMQRPVGVSPAGAPGRNATPTARRSWPNTAPRSSSDDLADVRRPAAEAGDAAHRVGRRSAAHLDRRAERPVQLHGPLGVDQLHRALDQVVGVEERVVGVGDDVDQRVADADDVEAGVAGREHGGRSGTADQATARAARSDAGTVARGDRYRRDDTARSTRTACRGPPPRPATTSSWRPTSTPATFEGRVDDRRRRHRAGRRARAQRHRARHRRGARRRQRRAVARSTPRPSAS